MFELVGMQTTYRPDDLSWCGDLPLGLAPEILQTCKTIHNEAAPILYAKNTFYFSLPDECTRGQLYTTAPAEELLLRSQCLWLFGYREVSWHTLFFEMQASLFARFLHRIGKENAASLTTIRILLLDDDSSYGEDDPTIGKALNVAIQLLHIHVSGLRDLSVIFKVDDLIPYPRCIQSKEEFGRDPDPYNLWWMPCLPPEFVMYEILKKEFRKLCGLKNLHFRGFRRDHYVMRELRKFEIADGHRKDQDESYNPATDKSPPKTPNGPNRTSKSDRPLTLLGPTLDPLQPPQKVRDYQSFGPFEIVRLKVRVDNWESCVTIRRREIICF